MVRIPIEYQEVEYLESTGDQYIDTGYFPNNTTKVLCDFLAPKASNNALLGCRDGGGVGALDFDAIVYDTGRYGLIIRFNSQNQSSGTFSINTRYALNIESGRIALNDTVFSTYEPTEFQCTKKTLTIFARNLNSGLIKGLARIYCFKMWDNDTLTLNLIPCYRKSDNEPGMYDTVSGTFFTNAGTGEFIVGNDVSWEAIDLLALRRMVMLSMASGAWKKITVTAPNSYTNAKQIADWLTTIKPDANALFALRDAQDTLASENGTLLLASLYDNVPYSYIRMYSGNRDSKASVWSTAYNLSVDSGDKYTILYQ